MVQEKLTLEDCQAVAVNRVEKGFKWLGWLLFILLLILYTFLLIYSVFEVFVFKYISFGLMIVMVLLWLGFKCMVVKRTRVMSKEIYSELNS